MQNCRTPCNLTSLGERGMGWGWRVKICSPLRTGWLEIGFESQTAELWRARTHPRPTVLHQNNNEIKVCKCSEMNIAGLYWIKHAPLCDNTDCTQKSFDDHPKKITQDYYYFYIIFFPGKWNTIQNTGYIYFGKKNFRSRIDWSVELKMSILAESRQHHEKMWQ